MKLYAIAFAAAGLLGVVTPAVAGADTTVVTPKGQSSQLDDHHGLRPEHAAKIREEIRLNEARAKELEPIIARDRQARHDVEVDWVVLERHAKELHAAASDFRGYGGYLTGRQQSDVNGFASDLETYAVHDEENAHFKHEIGERLEKNIQGEVAARDWHLKMVQRLRDWLGGNGG